MLLRASAIGLVAAGAALSGGCADLMQRSTIAPEWFQAKAVEVKGEGYPEFKDIPTAEGVKGALAEWEAEAQDLRKEAAAVEAQLASASPPPTEEEIRAKAAQWRAEVDEKVAARPQP
ncbi:MAG TPA: hypothetical protein VFV70_12195 [Hyphomonadaceae bacterium]|nr:hypothetical protein [Hyphomonadaceae bacterium]